MFFSPKSEIFFFNTPNIRGSTPNIRGITPNIRGNTPNIRGIPLILGVPTNDSIVSGRGVRLELLVGMLDWFSGKGVR